MTQVPIEQGFLWARKQHEAGKLREAESVYRQILAQNPDHARALHYLGVMALQLDQMKDAEALIRRSIALDSNVAEFHHNFGLLLEKTSRFDEAVVEYQAALKLSPKMPAAMNSLATILNAKGRHDEAIALFHEALKLAPDNGMIYNNLGTAEQAHGNYLIAKKMLVRAAELLPTVAGVQGNLGNLHLWSGQIDEAIAAYRKAVAIEPDSHILWSNLLMSLHYHPALTARQIREEHAVWANRLAAPVTARAPVHTNDRSPDRKLRIGYVSVDFREHPMAYFIEPVLRSHDRAKFEIFCYSDAPVPDHITERLRGLVDHWRDVLGSDSDELIASRIREDKIDILIDLSAHTAYNRLLTFARRPAPVQVNYLGYAATTGLPAIDWRVTDAIVDPPAAESPGPEKLLRLDRVFCAYLPQASAPEVAPSPAQNNGYITFGALCTLGKVNEEVMNLWAEVMRAVPSSRLLMRSRGMDDDMQQRLLAAFESRGVAGDRLELLGHTSIPEYFATFNRVDIELDPFPYSAHTTTCHSLWQGVPVITLTGQTTVSRVSASVLTSVGMADCVARDAAEYVEIAKRLAGDLPGLAGRRAGLRDRLRNSPLLDGSDLTRQLETAFRKIWIEWTRSAPPAPSVPAAPDLPTALAQADEFLAARRPADAEAVLRDADRRWPHRVEVQNNLAVALTSQGKYEAAIASARRAIALNPNLAEPHEALGNALQLINRPAEAVAAYENVLRLKPNDPDAHTNFGGALASLGKFAQAADAFLRAIQLRPTHVLALGNLGNVLLSLGRQRDAVEILRRALQIRPDFAGAASNLLLAQQNLDDIDPKTLAQQHIDWARKFAAGPVGPPHANNRDPHRPLRVGLVSPDLRQHPVGRYLLPVLANHDRAQTQFILYSDASTEDDLSAELRAASDGWRNILAKSDVDVDAMICADQIDILIDLAGHTARNRLTLFARKPAPVQATYLGYPGTTGLAAIDWRITDAIADPPGAGDALYVEKLLRLNGCAWCFDLPGAPEVSPAPAAGNKFITFGSFNNFSKVSPSTMRLWARILQSTPNSRLLIKANSFDDPQTADHVRRRFAEHGLDPARLDLVGRATSFTDHLRAYERIDIALDTFPYHGTTTTCEALWMGVPVITLAGQTHASRVGVSLFTAAGLSEWIASDADRYVQIASDLARDIGQLSATRSQLRQRIQSSELCNAAAFARRFERGIRQMWQSTFAKA